MRKPFTEQIQDHLKAGVTMCGSAYKFAKESGVQLPTLGRWLEGTQPRLAAVAPVMDYLGAQIVLPGETPDFRTYTQPLQLSLPTPEEADSTAPDDLLPRIRESWHGKPDMLFMPKIMESLNLAKENALLFKVKGPGMNPTMKEGDHALVNLADTKLSLQPGVFLVFSSGEFFLRRLYRTPEALIFVDEQTRAEQKIDPAYVTVLGRVVWVGKRLV